MIYNTLCTHEYLRQVNDENWPGSDDDDDDDDDARPTPKYPIGSASTPNQPLTGSSTT